MNKSIANGEKTESPKDWNWVTLDDVCDVLDSKRKPVKKADRKAGPYPYYGATGVLDYVDDYIFDETLVLIGEDGAKWESGENTAFIAEGKYWVNNHAHVVKPNENRLANKFLAFWLVSLDLTPYVSGLTVPKLNQEKLRSIPVPIPPLAEQKRIVAALNEKMAAVEKARVAALERVEAVRALSSAWLREVFSFGVGNLPHGWQWVKVEEAITKVKYTTKIQKKNYLKKGNHPVIDQSEKFISGYWNDGNDLFKIKKPVVIFGDHTRILKYVDFDFALGADGVKILQPRDAIDGKFFYYALKSVNVASLGYSRHYKAFQNQPFPLPSLPEQKRLVSALSAKMATTEKALTAAQAELEAITTLPSALLRKAFSGAL